MENKYASYPEGFEQLAKDLDMPFDDLETRKLVLNMLVNTLINN